MLNVTLLCYGPNCLVLHNSSDERTHTHTHNVSNQSQAVSFIWNIVMKLDDLIAQTRKHIHETNIKSDMTMSPVLTPDINIPRFAKEAGKDIQ